MIMWSKVDKKGGVEEGCWSNEWDVFKTEDRPFPYDCESIVLCVVSAIYIFAYTDAQKTPLLSVMDKVKYTSEW